jgi:hypothetical protein
VITDAEAVKPLGFTLSPGEASFDFLVVDHAERAPIER